MKFRRLGENWISNIFPTHARVRGSIPFGALDCHWRESKQYHSYHRTSTYIVAIAQHCNHDVKDDPATDTTNVLIVTLSNDELDDEDANITNNNNVAY